MAAKTASVIKTTAQVLAEIIDILHDGRDWRELDSCADAIQEITLALTPNWRQDNSGAWDWPDVAAALAALRNDPHATDNNAITEHAIKSTLSALEAPAYEPMSRDRDEIIRALLVAIAQVDVRRFLSVEDNVTLRFAELRDANADDLEMLTTLAAMSVGETRQFGGGASATFTIRRIEDNVTGTLNQRIIAAAAKRHAAASRGLLESVALEMEERGYPTTVEYPGCLHITNADERLLFIAGNVNEWWGIDVEDAGKPNIVVASMSTSVPRACQSPAEIAAGIDKTMSDWLSANRSPNAETGDRPIPDVLRSIADDLADSPDDETDERLRNEIREIAARLDDPDRPEIDTAWARDLVIRAQSVIQEGMPAHVDENRPLLDELATLSTMLAYCVPPRAIDGPDDRRALTAALNSLAGFDAASIDTARILIRQVLGAK